MKKENMIKVLIPLVAVVVVVESVILVSRLDKTTSGVDTTVVETKNVTPTDEVSQPVADFIFETESKDMKVGKSYKVALNLVGRQDVNLDAMEVYLKYDPEKVTVSQYAVGKGLPEDAKISGIDSKSGLVSSVLLWGVGERFSVKANEVNQILSFVVTPKVVGETSISLVTGESNQESVTMMVQSIDSKLLGFLGNQLDINATK